MAKEKNILEKVEFRTNYVQMTGIGQVYASYKDKDIGRLRFRVDGREDEIVEIGFGSDPMTIDDKFKGKGLMLMMCKEAIEYTLERSQPMVYSVNSCDSELTEGLKNLGFSAKKQSMGGLEFDECYLLTMYRIVPRKSTITYHE